MTDALQPDTEALMLAYVYGELSASASEAFERQMAGDPSLRAEVDGLMATREMLDLDLRYGQQSGLDQPPPHLAEAIFRAEALARPVELRDAVIQKASPRPETPPLMHRLSTWLLGGGLAVGAAAALLLLVTSSELSSPASQALSAPASEEAAAKQKKSNKASQGAKAAADSFADSDLADRAEPLEREKLEAKVASAEGGKKAGEPTYKIQDVFGDKAPEQAKADPAAARGGLAKDATSVQGVGRAPSKAIASRGDLDAPAEVIATGKRDASRSVTVQMPPSPASAAKPVVASPSASPADDAEGLEEADEGASAKNAAGFELAGPGQAGRIAEGKGASRGQAAPARKRAPRSSSVSSGPRPLPESVRQASKEKRDFRMKSAKGSKKKSKRQAKSEAQGVFADRKSNDVLQAADAESARGRHKEAAVLYIRASKRVSGSLKTLAYARFVKSSHSAGMHHDAVAGYRALAGRKKLSRSEREVSEAYLAAARSAEKIGNDALAAELYRKLVSLGHPSVQASASAGAKKLKAAARKKKK